MKIYSFILLVSVLSLLTIAFEKPGNPNPYESTSVVPQTSKVPVETLYSDFKNPWGIAWLPDGRLLVTERAGEILVFKDDKYTGEKLSGVPEVFAKGQGGLLDITLHPNYAQNKWIYIAYSKPVEGGATTAISRFKLNGNQVTNLEELFTAKPYIPANYHFGSRIVKSEAKRS